MAFTFLLTLSSWCAMHMLFHVHVQCSMCTTIIMLIHVLCTCMCTVYSVHMQGVTCTIMAMYMYVY